jgi:hypothetical protein
MNLLCWLGCLWLLEWNEEGIIKRNSGYYDGADNVFCFTNAFEANKGFIVQFPVDPFEAGTVTATFTSVANPLIYGESDVATTIILGNPQACMVVKAV